MSPEASRPPQQSSAGGSEEPIVEGLTPASGWHFLHLFYRLDRAALARAEAVERLRAQESLAAALGELKGTSAHESQCLAVPGHKAALGVVMAGPDLRSMHAGQMAIEASAAGPFLVPSYSFYSITEVSEYVPDEEAYAAILRDREGMDPSSTLFQTRVKQYGARLGAMNRQRLYPEFPDWPCLCFYPMNKIRVEPHQNWYATPFSDRMAMMTEHGKSGMKYAGKVSQVITASTGLDDWEWGVTLWGKNPAYLKDIVYTMRFDRASARYAAFGPFYFGYILPPAELVDALRI
jgi:chlorite dismutase